MVMRRHEQTALNIRCQRPSTSVTFGLGVLTRENTTYTSSGDYEGETSPYT